MIIFCQTLGYAICKLCRKTSPSQLEPVVSSVTSLVARSRSVGMFRHVLALGVPWSCLYAPTNMRAPNCRCALFLPAEQRALPHRQLCELVDHYYSWKQGPDYKTLKQSIK